MLSVVFLEGRKIRKTKATGGTGENGPSRAMSSGYQCTRLGSHQGVGERGNAERLLDLIVQSCLLSGTELSTRRDYLLHMRVERQPGFRDVC